MTSKRPTLYFAAPLFTEAERTFNLSLADLLDAHLSVYLPQRDGLLLRDSKDAGDDSAEVRRRIYDTDIAAIKACDILLAVINGPAVDDGVSFELGYATCLGKECVGLATDSRRAIGYFRNPMWDAALQEIFHSVPELVAWAATPKTRMMLQPTHASGVNASGLVSRYGGGEEG